MCGAPCQAAFTVYPGYDFNGNSLPGSPFPASTALDCQEDCYLRPDCLAFTFAGVYGTALQSALAHAAWPCIQGLLASYMDT